MKKTLSIVLILLFFPFFASATSGACSYHNGVDCSAGPNWDGSVICNDGWRDSSVDFYSIKECQNTTYNCTLDEQNALKEKYQFNDIETQITDLLAKFKAEQDAVKGRGDITQSGQQGLLQNVNDTYARRLEDLRIRETSAISNINSECQTLGLQEAQQRQSATQQKILEELQRSATPKCADNAIFNGSACVCNNGFIQSGNSCLTIRQYCSALGSQGYALNNEQCGCRSGYVLNKEKNYCVVVPTIIPEKRATPTISPVKTEMPALTKTNQVATSSVASSSPKIQQQSVKKMSVLGKLRSWFSTLFKLNH